MQHHLHALRQKPVHVRKNIALGVSAGFTALVAVIWVTTLASSGAFALAPLNAVGQDLAKTDVKNSFAETSSSFSRLMGAAGAAATGQETTAAPALTVIDGGSTSSLDKGTVAPVTATTLTF